MRLCSGLSMGRAVATVWQFDWGLIYAGLAELERVGFGTWD
jgi:hypothetical protein